MAGVEGVVPSTKLGPLDLKAAPTLSPWQRSAQGASHFGDVFGSSLASAQFCTHGKVRNSLVLLKKLNFNDVKQHTHTCTVE